MAGNLRASTQSKGRNGARPPCGGGLGRGVAPSYPIEAQSLYPSRQHDPPSRPSPTRGEGEGRRPRNLAGAEPCHCENARSFFAPKAVAALFGLAVALTLLFPRPVLAEDAPQKPLGDIPILHEEAVAAGLDSVYDGPWEYFVGGGGAAFDCDGSGFPSVFLAGGKNPAKLFVNKSVPGGPLRFEEKPLTFDAGHHELEGILGAYPLDIDGDGHMDLFVLRVGGNLLLKGGPDCTLHDRQQGMELRRRSRLDDFVRRRVGARAEIPHPGDRSLCRPPRAGIAVGHLRGEFALPPATRRPAGLFGAHAAGPRLLRAVDAVHRLEQLGRPLAARLQRPPILPRRRRADVEDRARQAAELYGRADGWRHLSIFGMGIAQGDFDGDGYPEYALTSMGDTKLQKLDAEEGGKGEAPVYRDIAGERGATAHLPYAGGDQRPSTGWHSEFADFNNAGLLDLFISKGNVEQMPDFASYDPNNLLLGQWNGKFAEAGKEAGIALNRKGRGALIDDFNLDGKLDLLVVNRGAPASLFRNLGASIDGGPPGPMGNWIEIRLSQPNPNRNAVGAKIAVKTGTLTMNRTIQVGGGDASGHAGWVHVGLGTAERAEIRVQWPDGEQSYPYRAFANQFVVVDRTKEQAAYWYPGR